MLTGCANKRDYYIKTGFSEEVGAGDLSLESMEMCILCLCNCDICRTL